ncbi:hypothetical protein COT75_00465 [Candidatus Beckwithbacteria bacterium CG10_big_fil_rev_8_21_14_0_10_34_10]|uniref:Peptidase M20 dimerisation domain-containing protein n=1 Tax=Candidatus Beckwithbacteria bacterium CG10_big_fil_rev_8_21_14_0_10_34_10 TaxID=1974495 RepID=A0A2H0WAJ2_9BACT|nr:MAG: hypothetical protein COT75_00465 [Candidatus Beckwithbacteria bacterium CG10_big_fil_rev_8_21_14_0_10_34_10]
MLNITKNLIKFESDKDHPKEIKKCFNYSIKLLSKSGLKVKTYSSKGKLSLVAGKKIKKHYQYILNGHLDVVPGDYKNAFKPYLKGSRLYGRGASDMKGPVGAMIKLMLNPGLKDIDLGLILNTDEEVGGFDGANYLVNQGYTADCVIVPDGGDNFNLTLAEKGVLHLKILAQGKSAHASRPWEGDNSLEKLFIIYEKIKRKVPDTTSSNRWLETVNLGKISGGLAANVVPSKAEMILDFRYPKKVQRKQILNLLKSVCQKETGVTFKILSDGQTMNTSKNNKYIKKIIKVAKENKVSLKLNKDHGASDGRFFSAKGIPVIMFKPTCSSIHIDDEWIDLKSLEIFYRILKRFMLK